MKQINLAIVICLIMILAGIGMLIKKVVIHADDDMVTLKAPEQSPPPPPSSSTDSAMPAGGNPVPSPQDSPAVYNTSAVSEQEKQSLQDMAKILYSFTKTELSVEALQESLKAKNQAPTLSESKNEIVVNTTTPPIGTKNFQAHYTVDEHGEKLAQHISFEFRPSPEAIVVVTQLLDQAIPGLGAPGEKRDDFVQWPMANSYVLWIKKLSVRDLESSPKGTYTDADIGTIRIMVEKALHDEVPDTNDTP